MAKAEKNSASINLQTRLEIECELGDEIFDELDVPPIQCQYSRSHQNIFLEQWGKELDCKQDGTQLERYLLTSKIETPTNPPYIYVKIRSRNYIRRSIGRPNGDAQYIHKARAHLRQTNMNGK